MVPVRFDGTSLVDYIYIFRPEMPSQWTQFSRGSGRLEFECFECPLRRARARSRRREITSTCNSERSLIPSRVYQITIYFTYVDINYVLRSWKTLFRIIFKHEALSRSSNLFFIGHHFCHRLHRSLKDKFSNRETTEHVFYFYLKIKISILFLFHFIYFVRLYR